MVFFQFMATWSIWSIIGVLISLVTAASILIYIFPRKALDNFYIDTKIGTTSNPIYSKVIVVKLTNHTNVPIYVLSLGFEFGSLVQPSKYGSKNAATGVYEIKFEGREKERLSEIDTLVRSNQTVTTWIPIEPGQSDDLLKTVLEERKVGYLKLKIQKVSSRLHPFTKLNIPV